MQENNFENDIQHCVNVLQSGGLILYPTDTIWGIGCDATNEAAVEKVFELKNRPDVKSLIVLVAGESDILQYVAAPDLALFDYLDTQTRPVTVIYDHAIGLAGNVLAADGSAGIRMANDLFCRALIKRFGKPIVSTSANVSGEPSPAGFATVSETIKNGVDYVVEYRQTDTTPAVPSRIIRWRNGNIVVIRD